MTGPIGVLNVEPATTSRTLERHLSFSLTWVVVDAPERGRLGDALCGATVIDQKRVDYTTRAGQAPQVAELPLCSLCKQRATELTGVTPS